MLRDTGIPEFLAGMLALIFFFWMFPVAVSINNFVVSYVMESGSTIENAPLSITAALAVLIFGLYGVLGVYFFTSSAEKVITWIISRREEKK